MSKYHIGEEEYKEIKKRIDLLWDLILHPNKDKCPNINELNKLLNIAAVYEDKVLWDKYKENFWQALFNDLKT
jgi:hypothetical protein